MHSSHFAQTRVAKSLNCYHELPSRHQTLVSDFEDNCKELLACIEYNSGMIDLIVEDVECMFENSRRTLNVSYIEKIQFWNIKKKYHDRIIFNLF